MNWLRLLVQAMIEIVISIQSLFRAALIQYVWYLGLVVDHKEMSEALDSGVSCLEQTCLGHLI